MKRKFPKAKLTILTVLLFLAGCGNSQISNAQSEKNKNTEPNIKASPPALPEAQKVEDGVIVHKIRLDKNDDASNVWIYLPEKTENKKLPVVLIAAAGSYLWNGISLGEGDQPEHLPYVRKGYAVIAYETPGSLKGVDMQKIKDAQILKAINDFKNSNAGLINQQNALNYALEKVPSLDAERIYIAGHSSAATHSLSVAANEPRIKAVIAYAPATDLEKSLAEDLEQFDKFVPGFKDFIKQSSPKNNIPKIKVPVFIFQAKDDSVIPVENTKTFVTELQKVNQNVTFVTVDNGDHYDSMIQQGIPKAIEWLNKIALASKSAPKNSK
jgi:dipeptidyl aminopeptidase/acylaminoacyl peptidase